VKSAEMMDYYAVLRRKIRDVSEDPAKMREVVYEAARLALRRQVNAQQPPLDSVATERHMSELEDAIARLEADAAGPRALDNGKPGEAVAAADHEASRPSQAGPAQSVEDAAFFTVGDPQIWGSPRAAPPDRAVAIEPIPVPDRAAAREPVLGPDRTRRSAYLVNPGDFVNPKMTPRVRPAPHSRAHLLVPGLKVTFQVAVATLAVAAFCVAMWGRGSPVQTAAEMQPAVARTSSVRPVSPPAEIADGTSAVAVAPIAPAPLAPAPLAAAPPAAAAPDTAPLATAPLPPAPAEAALPFPRPAAYGVYAIRDNQLIELEQAVATPVDPRTPDQLQIVKPGRIVSATAKLSFVVFRPDLVSNPPEKVSVRIAARIAHTMNFNSAGKAVVTAPATDTWLIRDQGYDLRATPMRESAEMVMLRLENPEFAFPPGRYELMLGGQAYDFVIAGEVTDLAHCVEGVVTVRGLAFYECKPVL
jgi:hypothetical protein